MIWLALRYLCYDILARPILSRGLSYVANRVEIYVKKRNKKGEVKRDSEEKE
jgi:hypothetical protein